MHILLIPFDIYTPKVCPYVGIFVYHQARSLKRAGYKVGVIAFELHPLTLLRKKLFGRSTGVEFEDDQGIPVYRYRGWSWIPFMVRWKTWLILRAGMMLFQKYVKEQGMPDLLHVHNALYAGLLASRIKKKFGVPYVITEHSSAYGRGLTKKHQIPCVEEAFKNADRRLAISYALGEILEGLLGDCFRPWQCVPNVLDIMFQNNLITGRSIKKSKGLFRFLTIGIYSEIKGQADLLQAFSLKFRGRADVQLRIGGGGALWNQLERLASELRIQENVIFLGDLEREQVLLEMQNCDTYVLSSHYETFGVVLIEALSCGKPVIATACGGPEEIVNPKNGILVPTRNIEALAEALGIMVECNNNYDSTWIQQECISRFGEQAFIHRLSNIYGQIYEAK